MGAIGSLFVNIGSKFDDKGFDKAKGSMTKLRAGITTVAKVGAAMGVALVAAGLKAAQMAGVQEQAELTLAQAMKQASTFTKEAFEHNLKYASSLQKLTVFGDENILMVQKQLTNFGIEGKMLDGLTKATLDLASAKGMDLKAAGDLVAKSVGSSTNALTRYGIEVKGSVGSTERAQTAIENISKLFGGAAAAQADTYLGRQKQLGNQWGDIVETIGFAVIPILTDLMKWIQSSVLPGLEAFFSNTENVDKITNRLVSTIKFLTVMVMGLMQAFNLAGDTIGTVLAALTKMVQGDFVGAFKIAKTGFADMGESMMQGAEDIKNVWKKAEEDKTKATKKANSTQNKIVKDTTKKTKKEIDNRLKHRIKAMALAIENQVVFNEQTLALTTEATAEEQALTQAFYDWQFEQGIISLETHKLNLEEKLNASTEGTEAHLELAKELFEAEKELRDIQAEEEKQRAAEKKERNLGLYNATKSLVTNLSDYESVTIKNDLQDSLESEQQKYDDKKLWIENNITDETEKTRLLEELDRDLKNTQDRLRTDSEKAERKSREKLKPFLIAEAIANTALGVTKAFAQGGMAGFITGALVAVAGAFQIAKIKAQRFAQGGIVGGSSFSGDNVVAGVNSGEMILNQVQQAELFKMANASGGGGGGGINIDLRGAVFSGKKAYKELEDSLFRVIKNNRKIA